MSNASNNRGRAYEFICLNSLHEAISAIRPAEIVHNSSYVAAKNAWNTLNRAGKTEEPKIKVPVINLPTTLLHIGFKHNSKTTIVMCFDNGWQFSFRIHNAKDVVEPSLKFDIQIVGMPADVNIKYNCKW